jgi:hypothetical protein
MRCLPVLSCVAETLGDAGLGLDVSINAAFET